MQEGERLWGDGGNSRRIGGKQVLRGREVWEGGSSFLPPFPVELPKEPAHGLPWHSRIISSGSSHFLCLGMSPTNPLSSWEWGMEGVIPLSLSLGCFPRPCPPHPKVLLPGVDSSVDVS